MSAREQLGTAGAVTGDLPGSAAGGPLAAVHHVFETHARATPDAPAVLVEDGAVSYGELNAMANRLAHRLRGLGVTHEELVAVCMRRSVETLAAILAVLKAGGAYVPMHPEDPQPRLDAVLADAEPRAVLAAPQDRGLFPEHEALWLDSVARSAEESDPGVDVGLEHAACVYYTSGSSGNAKGVVLEHGSIRGRLTWFDETLLGARELLIPMVNRPTFGASFKEFLVPWLRGAPAWLLDDAVAGDPVALLRALAQRPGVALGCVPQLWEAMLDAVEDGRALIPDTLSMLSFAGDSPSRSVLERSLFARPDLELWNVYASTESGHCIAARLRPGEPPRLGEPVGDAEVHLLDDSLRAVRPSEPGELYVGGPGLARGYLRRPELTAERFIPNPFSDVPGARLFKTGDRARRRSDSVSFAFVGRGERLLKIRGFRVEPGEVEDAIAGHPAVAQVAVTANRDEHGRDRLVAHVVPAPDCEPMLGELRGFLAATLPSYMLPTRLAVLDALPTMPSGKVDRRALDAPADRPRQAGAAAAAPANALERTVVELWQEVLGGDAVQVTDNFFEIGGDSLSAVRMVAEVHRLTGVELAPSVLLAAATPGQLAELIGRSRPGQPPSPLVGVHAGGTARPFFCVAPLPTAISSMNRLAGQLSAHRPVYVLFAHGPEDDNPTVGSVAARYVSAMREVQPSGPYLLGGQCLGAVIALEVAQQLRAAGERVSLLALFDPAPLHIRASSTSGRGLSRAVRSVGTRIKGAITPRRRPTGKGPVGYVTALHWAYMANPYLADPYPDPICHFFSSERIGSLDGYLSGWQAIAAGGLENVMVGSRHFRMLDGSADELSKELNRRLDAAEAGHAESSPPAAALQYSPSPK
jgi:amino acid adenylation domain-containing protein